MIWMFGTGIRWWPLNTKKVVHVFSNQQEKANKTYLKKMERMLTCWPLMVATGIDGVAAMLLSMVTVMWLGTLGGMGIWAWLAAGAGAIRRLGIGDFKTA